MTEPDVNFELAKTFGLTEDEYNRILKIFWKKNLGKALS